MKIIKSRYSEFKNIGKIAILADPGCRKGWEKNFSRLIEKVWKEHKPELFLVAGDMSLNSYDKEYKAIIKVFNKYPSIWLSIPGDHDRPLKKFIKYFGATRKVIDIDKWRFIGINTSNRMFLKKEREWMEKHVRKNTIILSHLPPEAKGWTFHSMWPRSSDHFLEVVKKYRRQVKGMFFGHLHGYSTREYLGIPMTITGAVAESKIIKNNHYSGEGFFEMVIFDTRTGKQKLCKLGKG